MRMLRRRTLSYVPYLRQTFVPSVQAVDTSQGGPFYADRVWETSTSTGTGSLTLLGAVTGYRSFSVVGTKRFYYAISNQDADEWETGIGYYSGGTLVRAIVLDSTTGSAISFSAGTKDVVLTPVAASFDNYDHLELPVSLLDPVTDEMFFGTGADGDVTISGTTTLTACKHYNNLTVTGTLNANGYRIFVKNVLYVTGTISATGTVGGSASGATGGTACGAGSAGETLSANGGLTTNAPTGTTGTGSAGAAGAAVTYGDGGNGGASSSTSGTALSTRVRPNIYDWLMARVHGGGVAGSNGPSGDGDGVNNGGGGGAGGQGGGKLLIIARTIINNGSIQANGGAGGTGGTP